MSGLLHLQKQMSLKSEEPVRKVSWAYQMKRGAAHFRKLKSLVIN